jgi:hypothetical protein
MVRMLGGGRAFAIAIPQLGHIDQRLEGRQGYTPVVLNGVPTTHDGGYGTSEVVEAIVHCTHRSS